MTRSARDALASVLFSGHLGYGSKEDWAEADRILAKLAEEGFVVVSKRELEGLKANLRDQVRRKRVAREKVAAHAEGRLKADLAKGGLVIAPREPTNAMLKAAAAAMSPEKRPTMRRVSVKQKHKIRYQAMLVAIDGGEK